MLTRIPFYHATTKKMVIAVGSLFSQIFCVTKTKENVTKKIVNVPLSYANKEKFIRRITEDPSLNEDVEVVLPRLSYEIVGYDYNSSSQLNKMNRIIGEKDGRNVFQRSPVPYSLTFMLYSYTRTQDDNLQIMEQILPYFTPDMNLSIKIMQNPDVNQDCSLSLSSVNTDDSYDGGYEDRKYIITTYSFILKMNYYGPISGIADDEKHFEESAPLSVIKKVSVNLNTSQYTVVVDPFDANATDPYTLDESWHDRNPSNDFDVGRKI